MSLVSIDLSAHRLCNIDACQYILVGTVAMVKKKGGHGTVGRSAALMKSGSKLCRCAYRPRHLTSHALHSSHIALPCTRLKRRERLPPPRRSHQSRQRVPHQRNTRLPDFRITMLGQLTASGVSPGSRYATILLESGHGGGSLDSE